MQYTEICWDMVSFAYKIIYIAITAESFSCLMKPFIEKKSALKTGAAYFCVMALLLTIPNDLGNIVAYSLGMCAAFIVMCQTDRRNYEQKLFLAVTFYALRVLSAALVNIFYAGMDKFILNKFANASLGVNFWAFFVVTVIYAALQFAVLRSAVMLLLRVYKNKRENLTREETAMLLVPSLVAVAGNEIQKNYQWMLEDSFHYWEDPFVGWKVLYAVFSFVSIFVMTLLFQKIREERQESLQRELLSLQLEHTREHIAQVESLYQDIRSIKHDMANHVVTLERLCGREESEDARRYVQHLKEQYFETAGAVRTGHPVTDVILREKSCEAAVKGIEFSCDFHYPRDTDVDAFDVSIILNNGLQNAFEAAARETVRKVSVSSYWKNHMFMIEIVNSFTGKLVRDAESGLPVTTKKIKGEHGYGLRNIEKVAQKYFGAMEIETEEGRVRLTVMMQMQEGPGKPFACDIAPCHKEERDL